MTYPELLVYWTIGWINSNCPHHSVSPTLPQNVLGFQFLSLVIPGTFVV